MKPVTLATCFVTADMETTKAFYLANLGAEVTFDCGWYLNLRFGGDEATTLQFISPVSPEMAPFGGQGATLNFRVEEVDEVYRELTGKGLEPTMPLEDHPWGDRGFSIKDPNGVELYFYSDREPSPEFAAAYR